MRGLEILVAGDEVLRWRFRRQQIKKHAISGITIVGSLLSLASNYPLTGMIMGAIAIVLAMVNVVGGFVVTDRMLAMFRERPEVKK